MGRCNLKVDNSAELFGAKTSIADLAQFAFDDWSSDGLHIYRAAELVEENWRDELAEPVEMEYALGISAKFKDGSALHVSAWADCCRPDEDGRYTHHCKWCGNG